MHYLKMPQMILLCTEKVEIKGPRHLKEIEVISPVEEPPVDLGLSILRKDRLKMKSQTTDCPFGTKMECLSREFTITTETSLIASPFGQEFSFASKTHQVRASKKT